MNTTEKVMLVMALLLAGSTWAVDRNVPSAYPNIQAAVNAAEDFDAVIIAPGRYSGLGNTNINLFGKKIQVRSTDPDNRQVVADTVIDCGGRGRAFNFLMGETSETVVSGLTIANGNEFIGGAIYCYNSSSPSISKCIIEGSFAVFGGAIACTNSQTRPEISHCLITGNSGLIGGGAIYCSAASPVIRNCVITGNQAQSGAGFYGHYPCAPQMLNCTITGNIASGRGGGIHCYDSSNLVIANTIVWGNSAASAVELMVGNGSQTIVTISYCDIATAGVSCAAGSSIQWGPGNIDVAPGFEESDYVVSGDVSVASDYHLAQGSACIDAGDPSFNDSTNPTDIDGDPRVSGSSVDIGADEFLSTAFTAELKISPQKLHLYSNGKWVTGNLSLPEDYGIETVNAQSLLLNGQLAADWAKADLGENKMMIKFPRAELQQMLEGSANPVTLTLTGNLTDGSAFEASDTITVGPSCN